MCQGRANLSKINRLHERCLRVIYSDKQSSYETLLENDGSVSIHNRNLQIFATEMYKVRKYISSSITTELFKYRDKQHYNLRNIAEFTTPTIATVYLRTESTSFLGSKI